MKSKCSNIKQECEGRTDKLQLVCDAKAAGCYLIEAAYTPDGKLIYYNLVDFHEKHAPNMNRSVWVKGLN